MKDNKISAILSKAREASKKVGAAAVKAGKAAGKASKKAAGDAVKMTKRIRENIKDYKSDLEDERIERIEAGEIKAKSRKNLGLSTKIIILTVVPILVITVVSLLFIHSSAIRCSKYVAKEQLASVAEAVLMIDKPDEAAIKAMTSELDLKIMIYGNGEVLVNDGVSTRSVSSLVLGETKKGAYQTTEELGGEEHLVCYATSLIGRTVKVSTPLSRLQKTANLAFITNAILMIFVLAICIIPVIPVTRKLARALSITLGQITRISEGDLAIEVDEQVAARKDELGTVEEAIKKLADNFGKLIGNIDETSTSLGMISADFSKDFDTVVESIGNVNVAMEEIAKGASSQASESSNLNEKFVSIGESIEAAGKSVEVLAQSTSVMKNYNKTAQQTIFDIEKMSRETTASVQEIKEQTEKTNKSAMQIRTATDMIADIASQTNLLSLNASIEAARAGEMGRGFAVVANEIRSLADQSKQSAQDIADIVKELIENSNISVEAMEKASEIMSKQSEGIITSKEVFSKLNDEIDNVVGAVGVISEEVKTLGKDKNEAMSGMGSLAAIAEENAASTWETSASMNTLNDVVVKGKANTDEIMNLSKSLKEKTDELKLAK